MIRINSLNETTLSCGDCAQEFIAKLRSEPDPDTMTLELREDDIVCCPFCGSEDIDTIEENYEEDEEGNDEEKEE